MRGSLLAKALLASMAISGASAVRTITAMDGGYPGTISLPRSTRRNYGVAKGKTGALKIRRAATKARNVRKHKRNCRG